MTKSVLRCLSGLFESVAQTAEAKLAMDVPQAGLFNGDIWLYSTSLSWKGQTGHAVSRTDPSPSLNHPSVSRRGRGWPSLRANVLHCDVGVEEYECSGKVEEELRLGSFLITLENQILGS